MKRALLNQEGKMQNAAFEPGPVRRYLYSALCLLALLIGACAVHVEFPRHGVVIDDSTGDPIPNVAVSADLRYTCYLPPNPAGPGSEDLGEIVTTTDSYGRYSLPLRIFLKPPLWCLVNRSINYLKPGYFSWGYHVGFRWDPPEPANVEARLQPMTHLLHFLPDDPARLRRELESGTHPEIERKNIAANLNLKLSPTDEIGTFARLPGSRIDRVQAITLSQRPSVAYVFIHDAAAGRWFVLDDRGTDISNQVNVPRRPGLPGSNDYWGDSLLNRSESSERIDLHRTVSGERRTIHLAKGGLTAIVGGEIKFATIEGNGAFLCIYHGETVQIISATELIHSPANMTARLVYLHAVDHIYYVILRAEDGWRILGGDGYQQEFREMGTFPASVEITASYFERNHSFLAFREEGVRLFSLYYGEFKEIPSPIADFTKKLKKEIISISGDFSRSTPLIYMAYGGDRVLRFSREGRPDYPVRAAESPPSNWFLDTKIPHLPDR